VKLLLYAPTDRELTIPLLAMARRITTEGDLEHFDDLLTLRNRLHRPLLRPAAALLLLSTPGELAQAVSLRDLLDDVRNILILPDQEAATVRLAQMLSPRFMQDADQDPNLLSEVVRRVTTHMPLGWEGHNQPAA
jgi:hypothetical protein